jgi:hypothetical protein
MNNFYQKIVVTSICTVLSFSSGVNKEAKAAYFLLSASSEFEYLAQPPIYLYEFNLASIPASFSPNTSNFSLGIFPNRNHYSSYPSSLAVFGYVGDGLADARDLESWSGEGYINGVQNLQYTIPYNPMEVDVTSFVRQLLNQNNTFAGFRVWGSSNSELTLNIPNGADLLITDNVPAPDSVPEPTTIFGSVFALSLGRWLRRKKFKSE